MNPNLVKNTSLLQSHKWKILIKRLPNVDFFCKQVNIPGIVVPPVQQPTPFKNIPYNGDHLTFDPFNVTFQVDEDLSNFVEITTWLKALSSPKSFEKYKELKEARNKMTWKDGLKSDITLIMLKNSSNPNLEITYYDAFPVALSGLDLNNETNNTNAVYSTIQFEYTDYEINKT